MSWVYQVPGLDGLLESRVGLDAEEERRANVIGGCKCGLRGFVCQPHGTVTRLDGSVVRTASKAP